MKFSRQLILAGTVLASSAIAQTEQWLEYHTGTEARSYRSVTLTTNTPNSVALPKLNGTPYFARWSTPLDDSGKRWLCLDRSRASGPYDRLYIDSNGNGQLDDETPILARVDSYNSYFPPAPVVYKGEDGPISYHLILRFYKYDNSSAQLLASSGGWYEGVVDFGGKKKHVELVDGNVNGLFNDVSTEPANCDRIRIEGDKTSERYLGKMVEVDGNFFQIEVARDGAFIKLQKAENLIFGAVQVPENISEFAAFGKNGHFVRKPVKGELTLPEGRYAIHRWTINRKDEKGVPWTLAGYNFPKKTGFEVVSTNAVALTIGEPVTATLSANERGNRQVGFNLSFVGQQKESIEMLRDGNSRPRGPKLILTGADGAICYTNTFEFG